MSESRGLNTDPKHWEYQREKLAEVKAMMQRKMRELGLNTKGNTCQVKNTCQDKDEMRKRALGVVVQSQRVVL